MCVVPFVDTQANGDDSKDVGEQADETMDDFSDRWFHEMFKLVAEFGENAAERSNDSQQIGCHSEKRMRCLIM